MEIPQYNPAAAASKAILLFDKNLNGKIEGDEFAACPGVKSALKLADTDKNGELSEAELTARLQDYVATNRGLFPVNCLVRIDGQPAAGAEVVLVPEPFLQATIKPAKGVSNEGGYVFFQVEGVELPGAQLGMYRVEITLPGAALPEKYNTKTELGLEVAMGSRELESTIPLDLTLKEKSGS